MPPKASTNNGKAGKTYSADVVAAVLMATGTTSLSMKHYEIMSSLDGVKTASAYQHDFRAVLAKAKELKTRVDNGEAFEPVTPSTKRGEYSCAVEYVLARRHSPFTSALLPQPTLTCCLLLGSYKNSPLSNAPIFLTLFCTFLPHPVPTTLLRNITPTYLVPTNNDGQGRRFSRCRSEDDPSGLCLCLAHGTW
jgi:hypothetical protein